MKTKDIMERIGLDARAVKFYVENEVIVPSKKGDGRGKFREYSQKNLRQFVSLPPKPPRLELSRPIPESRHIDTQSVRCASEVKERSTPKTHRPTALLTLLFVAQILPFYDYSSCAKHQGLAVRMEDSVKNSDDCTI